MQAAQDVHRLASGRSDGDSAYRRQTQSHEQHQGGEHTSYHEEQRLRETVNEHEEAQVRLERDYADSYALSRSYSGREGGVLQTQGDRDTQRQGTRQQHTDLTIARRYPTGPISSRLSLSLPLVGSSALWLANCGGKLEPRANVKHVRTRSFS